MLNDSIADPSAQEKLRKLHFEDGSRMLIAGVRESYTPETAANIPQQWERFAPRLPSVPGRLGKDSWGVCFNRSEDGQRFDYLCGVVVSEKHRVKTDWDCVELPSQRYAALIHHDHISRVRETIDLIVQGWLPHSHYTAANTDPSAAAFLERYTEKYDAATGEGGLEIWVPIKPLESKYARGRRA